MDFDGLKGADSPFMKGFYDKGRVSGLLKDVPVYAVLVEDIGLRGAHFVAFRVRTKENGRKRPREGAVRKKGVGRGRKSTFVMVSAWARGFTLNNFFFAKLHFLQWMDVPSL